MLDVRPPLPFPSNQKPAVRAGLHGEEPLRTFRAYVRPAAGQVHDGGDGREHHRSRGGVATEAAASSSTYVAVVVRAKLRRLMRCLD